MNDMLYDRRVLVVSLLVGSLGIAILWAGGVDFPVAVPPGLVILLVGAFIVLTVRRSWTAWLGSALGVFVGVGFVLAGMNGDGFDYILGREGRLVAAGQVIELIGVVAAAVTGAMVARHSSD